MNNPFGTQPYYASTLDRQTVITKEGKKIKKIVSYIAEQDRLIVYFDKRAHTVKQINEGIWQEVA
jgi:hypothetical protein